MTAFVRSSATMSIRASSHGEPFGARERGASGERVDDAAGNPIPTYPQATVTGLPPGSGVCIDVVIVRDGRTSPNPLKACSS